MHKNIKRTALALFSTCLLSCAFCTASFASAVSPSQTEITIPKSAETFSFDVILDADTAFAGAEFGLKPSSSDVEFSEIEFADELQKESQVKTLKDGVLYFGFFSSENKFSEGEHKVATVTYKYTGSAQREVTLVESKIVTVDESTDKTSGDTSSEPFTVTIKRSDNGGSSGGGGGGGGGGTTSVYDIHVEDPLHGTVTVSPEKASEGSSVTVKISPDEGYELESISVTDKAGKDISAAGSGSSYTFTMPSSDVTVKAVFKEKSGGGELPFADVASGAWYADAVEYVYENGLMSGTSASTFQPDVTTTRGMIVTVLHRLEGEPDAASSGFTDVADGQYFAEAVAWAAENSIVNGYGDGRFGPDDPITREQMASILYRYASFKGYDVTSSNDLGSYTDAAQISSYALTALQWANAEKLVTGTGDTTLNPKGDATRAEIAAILMRFCENIAEQV